MLKKYKKKPVIIEAVQYNSDDLSAIAEIIKFLSDNKVSDYDEYLEYGDALPFEIYPYRGSDYEGWRIIIKTLEGDMTVGFNDYIIKGVNGEFYPCKPDIFEKTYDEVTE